MSRLVFLDVSRSPKEIGRNLTKDLPVLHKGDQTPWPFRFAQIMVDAQRGGKTGAITKLIPGDAIGLHSAQK